MARWLIGFGANLGEPQATYEAARRRLADLGLAATQSSSLIRTTPIGVASAQPDYQNGAFAGTTTLEPLEVLEALQTVEHELGRTRDERWGARKIDLDLLLYDDLVIATPRLVVPHPRFALRWFAVAPAAEIAPDWVHPVLGWTLERLCRHLAEAANYAAFCGGSRATARQLVDELAEELPVERVFLPEKLSPSASDEEEADELKRLVSGLEQLTLVDPADYPATGERWLISDFWAGELDRLLPNAAPAQQAELGKWRAAVRVRPKLLVMIENAADPLAGELPSPPVAHTSQRAPLLMPPLPAPLLRCSAGDFAWAKRELAATLHAMRPLGSTNSR